MWRQHTHGTTTTASDIRLIREDEAPLDPSKLLQAQDIDNANLIYVVYKKEDGTWDEIRVMRPVYSTPPPDPGTFARGGSL